MTATLGPAVVEILLDVGVPYDRIVQGDGLRRLLIEHDMLGRELRSLDPEQVSALGRLWPNDGSVEVRTDQLTEVDLSSDVAAERLASLSVDTTYTLRIYADKTTILNTAFPRQQAAWFATGEACIGHLRQGTSHLREWLFPDPTQSSVLLVGDRNVRLTGPLLDVRGGRHVDFSTAHHEADFDMLAQAERMNAFAVKTARWTGLPAIRVTPLHLALQGDGWETDLGRSLLTQYVVLALLYLADRSRPAERAGLRFEFAGHDRFVGFEAGGSDLAVTEESQRIGDDMLALLRWCFDEGPDAAESSWMEERLQLLQVSLVDMLYPVQPERRAEAFMIGVAELFRNARASWKSFLARTVDAHARERAELLRTVEAATRQVVDRTAAIGKGVIESMLAAVGVIVGLFVASALQEEFRADLFRIGLYAYAGYLVLFPAAFGLLAEIGRFNATQSAYKSQRENFRVMLGADVTDALEGTSMAGASRYFWWSVTAAAIVYVLVAAGALVAAEVIPHTLKAA